MAEKVEKKIKNSPPSSSPAAPAMKNGDAGKEQKKRKPRKCAEVTEMQDGFQKLADRLLTEGATFEEVIASVAERTGPRLTLAAVQDYFRRNLTLQMQRVRHQVNAAKALKAALGNPDSAEGELAEAAFFTGYLCLGRSGSEATLKDAERARLLRENLRLHQHVLRLKEQREVKELEFLRARTAVELAKQRALKKKVTDLHRSVTQNGKMQGLAPEAIEKIREIYGLVQVKPPYTTGGQNSNPTA
jgi:hypothetical protein